MSTKLHSAVEDEAEGVPASLDIKELMETHREAVKDLERRVADALPVAALAPSTEGDSAGEGAGAAVPSDGTWMRYDDLFFLRYILSFGSAEKAEPAVRECLRYRADPVNKAYHARVADGTWEECEEVKTHRRYEVASLIRDAQVHGGVTVIIRGRFSNVDAVHRHLSKEDLLRVFLLYREQAYHHCDAVQRATGRLVKQVLCMDLDGVPFGMMAGNSRMHAIHGEVSAVSTNVYPQLQDKMCILNTPSWMSVMLRIARTFIPARMMAKIETFSSPADMWASDWAKATLKREGWPSFLGGTLPDAEMPAMLSGSLLVPREEEEGALTEITVPNRASSEVRVNVPINGCKLRFLVSLDAHGIALGSRLLHGAGEGAACSTPAPDGGETVLRTPDRADKVKADAGAVHGEWLCPVAGVVVVTFDNTYSLLRSKTIRYHFEVVDPAADGAAVGEAAAGKAAAGSPASPETSPAAAAAAAAAAGGAGGASTEEVEVVL